MDVEDYQEWLEKVWFPHYVMRLDAEPPRGFCVGERGTDEYEAVQLRLSVTG